MSSQNGMESVAPQASDSSALGAGGQREAPVPVCEMPIKGPVGCKRVRFPSLIRV